MIRAREVHHKIENKWGKEKKKKHWVGMAYKANEDTKWSSIHHQNPFSNLPKELNTVVHGHLKYIQM